MPANNRKKKYGLGRSKEQMELDLPSGNTCLLIRPGVQGLMKMGILDSFDSLTSMVQKNLDAADPMKDLRSNIAKLAQSPGDIEAGLALVDKVVAGVLLEPKVILDPPDANTAGVPELPDGQFYASEVDLDDKMFILQFVVGGTRDLEAFRKQQSELLDGMANVSQLAVSTE